MKKRDPTQNYRDVIEDDMSLKMFLTKLQEFDGQFCRLMFQQEDFTLKLEVRGVKGRLEHVRVLSDLFSRPPKRGKNEEKVEKPAR